MSTVDLALFQEQPNGAAAVQAIIPPGGISTLVTGQNKLVQRYLVRLLTETGSMQYNPTEGTKFMTMLRGGACCSWQLISDFALAMLDLDPAMRAEEMPTDPPEEKYAGSELRSVLLQGTDTVLNIFVRNAAGVAAQVYLPLSFILNP